MSRSRFDFVAPARSSECATVSPDIRAESEGATVFRSLHLTSGRILIIGTLVAVVGTPLLGQASSVEPTGPAAFLFAYLPKSGQEALFDAGYRRHLSWHGGKGDPLPWYAWYVTTGERTGTFIDGTFGISFSAFDQRVEPKADGADFAQNVAPFATPSWRAVYRLRPELSTGQPLEKKAPTPLVEVTHVAIEPGFQRQFEELLAAVRSDLARAKPAVVLTAYELISGGEQPSYMVMVARSGWASYDTLAPTADLISRSPRATNAIDGGRRPMIKRISTETWSYRSDLSLFD